MGDIMRFKTDYTTSPPTLGEPTTYRIQRLTQKPKSEWHARLSQVFGGGMYQMSEGGWKVCQEIFDFDHMGNAEYEFGAIPTALKNIVSERADYLAWSFVIKSADVKLGWWRQRAVDTYRRAEIQAAKRKREKPPRMSPKHKKEHLLGLCTELQERVAYAEKARDEALAEKDQALTKTKEKMKRAGNRMAQLRGLTSDAIEFIFGGPLGERADEAAKLKSRAVAILLDEEAVPKEGS